LPVIWNYDYKFRKNPDLGFLSTGSPGWFGGFQDGFCERDGIKNAVYVEVYGAVRKLGVFDPEVVAMLSLDWGSKDLSEVPDFFIHFAALTA